MKNSRFKKLILNIILAITAGVFLFSGEALARKTTTISGCITDAITGAPVQGVRFYIVDALGQYKTLEQIKQEYDDARNKNMSAGASGQLQTDTQGYYNFEIWDWRDNYQNTYGLVPFYSNYSFDPPFKTFDLGRVDRNYPLFDFTAQRLYTISGYVKYDDGTPIKDVNVYIGGSMVTTDKNGYYKMEVLGEYQGKPQAWWVSVIDLSKIDTNKPDVQAEILQKLSETGFTWKDPIAYENITFEDKMDKPNKNFTASTHYIEGYLYENNKGLDGVTVKCVGNSCRGVPSCKNVETKTSTVVGKGLGYYRLEGLYNGKYTVTVDRTGFLPPTYVLEVKGNNYTEVNFCSYIYTISGFVKDYDGKGIEGVTVSAKGISCPGFTTCKDGSDTTKSTGYYEIDGLYNGTYNITASHPDYKLFDPASYDDIVIEGADRGNVNFYTYGISGRVTRYNRSDLGLNGITVNIHKRGQPNPIPTVTDEIGYYEQKDLSSGTYDVAVVPNCVTMSAQVNPSEQDKGVIASSGIYYLEMLHITRRAFWGRIDKIKAQFCINDGGDKRCAQTDSLSLNKWYDVVGTYDGNSIKIYLDGTLANEVAYVSSPPPQGSQPEYYFYPSSRQVKLSPGSSANAVNFEAIVPPKKIESITASSLSGPAPLEVTFSSQCSGDVEKWLWDFGDTNTSTEQNPTHIYTQPRVYKVTFTVYAPYDETGKYTKKLEKAIQVYARPVAKITADKLIVNEGNTVELDGSGSSDFDGIDWARCSWATNLGTITKIDDGSQATFTAPQGITTQGPLTAEVSLVVVDSSSGVESINADNKVGIKVNRKPTNIIPTVEKPVANEGTTVTLTGSAQDPDGDTLYYSWEQIEGPKVTLTATDDTAKMATFTAPRGIVGEATLQFKITSVRDREDVRDVGFIVTSDATVEVKINRSPADVNAGENQIVNEGTKVTLTGSAQDPDGDTLYYTWKQVEGQDVTLTPTDSTARNVTFTAPTGIAGEAKLKFQITLVRDRASVGSGMFIINSTATVEVKINRPPANVNAGTDQLVSEGALVKLKGSATDPDGDKLYYKWEPIGYSGATLESADDDTPEATFTAPANMGQIEFRLTVRDRAELIPGQAGFKVPATPDDDTDANRVIIIINRPPYDVTAEANTSLIHVKESDKYYGIVTLTGSASKGDPGETLYYKWEQISGPVVGTIKHDVETNSQATYIIGRDAQGKEAFQDALGGEFPGGIKVKFTLTVRDHPDEAIALKAESNEVEVTIKRYPYVEAGSDRIVNAGDKSVQLEGGVTELDGDDVNVRWLHIELDKAPWSTIGAITLKNPITTIESGLPKIIKYTIEFDAPTIPDTYKGIIKATFQLTATENVSGIGSSDTVTITINRKPIVVAKVDPNAKRIDGMPVVNEGESIQLFGEAQDYDGDVPIDSWVWTKEKGPDEVDIGHLSPNNKAANPTFTPPIGIQGKGPQIVTFRLTVTGNTGIEYDKDFDVTERIRINRPPIAVAGEEQTVDAGTRVTLHGEGSYDPDSPPDAPDADIETYNWSPVGFNISFLPPDPQNPARASFIAPTVSKPTSLTFKLVVTDKNNLQNNPDLDDDEVIININPATEVIYVDDDDDDTTAQNQNGTSEHPYITIGEALKNADSIKKSIIEVKPGTYNEAVTLKNGITLRSSSWSNKKYNEGHATLPSDVTISDRVKMANDSKLLGFVVGEVKINGASNVKVAYNRISSIDITNATGDITIHNNIIPGGIDISGGNDIKIINNTIDVTSDNGIDIDNESLEIKIINNIIAIEVGPDEQYFCINNKGSAKSINYNYLYVRPDKRGEVYGDIYGGFVDIGEYTGGNGNITVKGWTPIPLYADGDFHLDSHSECVDGGDNNVIDELGHTEVNGKSIDIGAYGSTSDDKVKDTTPVPIAVINNLDPWIEEEDEVITFKGIGEPKTPGANINYYKWTIIGNERPIITVTKGINTPDITYDPELPLGSYIVTLEVMDNFGHTSMPSRPRELKVGFPVISAYKGTRDSITLIWQDNSTTEDGFVVERKESGETDDEYVIVADGRLPGFDVLLGDRNKGERSWTDSYSFEERGKSYYYRVGAVKNSHCYYSEMIMRLPPLYYASAPDKVKANIVTNYVGTVMINLSWIQDAASSVTGYRIYRSINDPAPLDNPLIHSKQAVPIADVANTIYQDPDIAKENTYYYKITAYNNRFGEGSPSEMVKITIPDNIPPTVYITSPTSGQYLSGNVEVNIEAFDFEKEQLTIRLEYKKGETEWKLIKNLELDKYEDHKTSAKLTWDTSSLIPGKDYAIRVTATDANPEPSEYIVSPLTITDTGLPIAGFTARPPEGELPLKVEFRDNSLGFPTEWKWSFGDGQTGYGEIVTHEYKKPGRYTVKLTAKNIVGTNTKEVPNCIEVLPPIPIADFTASPAEGYAPLTVNLKDESTGDIVSWLWDFGDGTTSTLQNPTHTYSKDDTYTVTLTVTNPRRFNNTDYKTVSIKVLKVPPLTAKFSADPKEGDAPLRVQFTDESEGGPTEWVWDFGDGQMSREQNPIHVYNQPKKYTVSLIVGNPSGFAQTGDIITVTPIANFGPLIPRKGEPPFKVDFKDSSLGNIASWLWDFGDGTTSTLQNPTHVYEEVGTYTVSLIVTNSKGISHKETKKDIITVIAIEDSTPPRIYITSPYDYSGIPDGKVLVKGYVLDYDLPTVEVKVDSGEWVEARDVKKDTSSIISKYTFSCEVTIPQPPELYNDILDIYKDYWNVKFSVITAKATDTSGNSSSDSVNVIRGHVLLIWLPHYYSASGYKGLTSIAVAKDILWLMKPNQPLPSNEEIHKHGIAHNLLIDLSIGLWFNELDPYGLKAALNNFQNILTFEVAQYDEDDFDEFIRMIVKWLNTPILNLYIPVAIAQRDIGYISTDWLLATGFVTDKNPNEGNFTVYGLFLTDIDGGIGVNTFIPIRELRQCIIPMQPLPNYPDRYGRIPEDRRDLFETGYGQIPIKPININDFDDAYNGKYIAVK